VEAAHAAESDQQVCGKHHASAMPPPYGLLQVGNAASTPIDFQLLSVKQAAHILGVSQKTVRRLLARGGIKFVRIGRSVRIDHRELESVMKTGTDGRKLKAACAYPSDRSERHQKSQSSNDTED
jgi:excisionase family DNA binding protein